MIQQTIDVGNKGFTFIEHATCVAIANQFLFSAIEYIDDEFLFNVWKECDTNESSKIPILDALRERCTPSFMTETLHYVMENVAPFMCITPRQKRNLLANILIIVQQYATYEGAYSKVMGITDDSCTYVREPISGEQLVPQFEVFTRTIKDITRHDAELSFVLDKMNTAIIREIRDIDRMYGAPTDEPVVIKIQEKDEDDLK